MKFISRLCGPLARKILLSGVALVLLLGLLGFFALPHFLRPFLEQKLSDALHRPVKVAELAINPYALSATVKGFSVGQKEGPGELLGFDELYVNLEASSLMHLAPVVNQLRLTGPRLHLVRSADKRYNVSDLIEEFLAKPDSPPSRFALYNIQLSGGRILFEDGPKKQRHELSDLALGIPFISNLPSQVDVFVQPSLAAKVNGAAFSLAGKARPFAQTREASLDVALSDLDLRPYLEYLPLALDLRLPSARLDTKLAVVFSQPEGKSAALTVSGELALRKLQVQGRDGRTLMHVERIHGRLKSLDVLAQKASVDSLTLESLSLPQPGEKQDAFTLDSLKLTGVEVDGLRQSATVAQLSAAGGKLRLARELDGSLSLSRLLPPAAGNPQAYGAGKPRPAAASGKAQDKAQDKATVATDKTGWTVVVAKLALEGWAARFEDRANAKSPPLVLAPLAFTAENLSTARSAQPRLALKAGLGKAGHLEIAGEVGLAPLSGKFELDVKGLDLVPLQAYVTEGINLTLTRGALEGKGSLSFAQPAAPGALKAQFKGSLGLMDLGLVEKGNASDLLKWKALRFSGVNAALGGEVPVELALSEIALKDFFARLVINADGSLALRHLLKGESHALGEGQEKTEQGEGAKPAAAAAVALVPAAAPAAVAGMPAVPDKPAAYRIRVDKLAISGGRVRFSDLFIKPNYSANLTGLSGSVKGLSSVPGTMAMVDIAGTVDEVAPLTIAGRVNPLAKDLFLDLTADAKGIEMSGFSPYAARYAGYGIEKGKLSANIHYFIENRQLKAENHLFLDQLTFGQKVDSPQATSLPVLLAVALLKNGRGEIDINLPISGSLDDPQFSIGGIVFKMFLNLIVKAVTSPFALIGSLFGGGEELAWLEFDAGRSAILPAGVAKLEKLAKALKDRPGLKLELTGRADGAADTEGVKRAQLERKLKAQKLKDTVKKGEASVSVDEITLDKDEWPKYLALAYKEENFKKPKNMIGFTKSLPPEEMEKLILANIQVSEDMLRRLAERRGKAAGEWLVKTGGVPSERVFVLAPKLGAETAKSGETPEKSDKPKLSPSRVDFSLK